MMMMMFLTGGSEEELVLGGGALNIMKIRDPVFKPLVWCQLKHEATDAEENTPASLGQHQPVSFGTRDPGVKEEVCTRSQTSQRIMIKKHLSSEQDGFYCWIWI